MAVESLVTSPLLWWDASSSEGLPEAGRSQNSSLPSSPTPTEPLDPASPVQGAFVSDSCPLQPFQTLSAESVRTSQISHRGPVSNTDSHEERILSHSFSF